MVLFAYFVNKGVARPASGNLLSQMKNRRQKELEVRVLAQQLSAPDSAFLLPALYSGCEITRYCAQRGGGCPGQEGFCSKSSNSQRSWYRRCLHFIPDPYSSWVFIPVLLRGRA
ncbi:hypothetical protein GRJ2_001742600 [Grus japonensis]|uniref:Uncharacterized protein n=1 Tax=Grus japonensis TaxID=30415 RepID=A0ABC9X525_GRUJA